jgi:hypothetical protein
VHASDFFITSRGKEPAPMADKVTLWRIPNGMHYSTQGAAEVAEVEAELLAFLTHAGLDEGVRGLILRAALTTWNGPPERRAEIEGPDTPEDFAARQRKANRRERGAAVLARYAAALAKHADTLPHEAGSQAELRAAGMSPTPVQVAEPVRRRGIRTAPREADTPEGDSPGPIDWASLPRPSGRRSSGG